MKIPQTFQDYSDDDPAIDKRVARWDFWKALAKLKDEYFSIESVDANLVTPDAFYTWVKEQYGLELTINVMFNGITDEYRIVDEKKFLIFTLKYLGD